MQAAGSRDGLDLRKSSYYDISTTIFMVAWLTTIQVCTDLFCPNVVENIAVQRTEPEELHTERQNEPVKQRAHNGGGC
ncbi:hypothetical protein MRX96_028282 [Rhipicephalus microplus]